MKRNLIIIIITIIGFLYFVNQNKSNEIENDKEKAINNNLLIEIRKEPKIKEAIITDVNVLYVSVLDDNTSRNGYADYLCEIVKKHSSKIKLIRVMKFGSTNDPNKDNAYGIILGESNCN